MKKILLLSFLIVSAVNSFAFVTQGHWRWRKDDGSETAATWLAAEETEPIISNSGENIRLRLQFFNSGTGNTDMSTTILVYSADGGTSWDSVTTTAGSRAFVLAGTSGFVTDLEATTQQLTTQPGYSYTPGQVITSTNVLGTNNIVPNAQTEYEWVIRPTSNMQPATTYLFKGDTKPGDNTFDGTLPPASLTTAAVLPILLADFSVKADGKKVRISWSTATEQNNDRFEIERSADGRTWQTIATVKGSGTTTQVRNYQAYDNLPLRGTNYYRIKQFDLYGKSSTSDIRTLKMLLENSGLLNVFPNPAKSIINYKLSDYSGSNIVATLSNSNGKIIHRETLKEIVANTSYQLKPAQQPAPGVYYLQLKGEGLSETIKVIVQ